MSDTQVIVAGLKTEPDAQLASGTTWLVEFVMRVHLRRGIEDWVRAGELNSRSPSATSEWSGRNSHYYTCGEEQTAVLEE